MPFSTNAVVVEPDQLTKALARFWPKVRKTDKCWFWIASKTRAGYGQFWFSGVYRTAHRVAYALLVGDVLDGMVVCHACDEPSCVRPDHLFTGTQADNMKDCARKGRRVPGMLGRVGEMCPGSKLTDADVLEMRRLYETGDVTQVSLGRKFGLHRVQVNKILNRKIWKHV